MTATPVRHIARRKFGFWMATALVIGNIIGAGIFLLPAGLAPFGWNAVSAWGVTAVGALSLAWVFAELSRQLPDAGGSVGFMRLGLGDGAAFLGAWGYVISIWVANAGITMAGVSYLTRLVPSLEARPGAIVITALAVIWLLTWVNLRGLRAAGSVQSVTTVIKLLPFVVVIGLAFWRVGTDGFAALPPITDGTFTLPGATGAVGLTLFAMLGLESAAMPVDAVEQPEKNIPRATLAGTGISAIVSLMATCAVVLMLPREVVEASRAPTSDFVAASFGSMSGTLVAACAVVSAFGCLNGWLLLGGEVPVAMTQSKSLPDWFGRLNRHGAPANSIVLGAAVTSAMTLLAATKVGIAAFNFLILIATATNLLLYLLCLIAAARFMRDQRVRTSAGLVAATALAFVFVLWAFYSAGRESLAWGAVLTAAGWPIYRLARRLTSP